jgi:hypothetical protein
LILIITLAGGVLLPASQLLIQLTLQPRLYTVDDAPQAPVAIVFGAGLRRDGAPSPVLRGRVETAVQLYLSGKASKLLMSGDNRFVDYNEPGAMTDYAISLAFQPKISFQDFAVGVPTYLLPRALYLRGRTRHRCYAGLPFAQGDLHCTRIGNRCRSGERQRRWIRSPMLKLLAGQGSRRHSGSVVAIMGHSSTARVRSTGTDHILKPA